jgi:predicted ATPase/DNA-binding SARP family transcriptional activator
VQVPLEIRVLGPFEVLVGDTLADVGGAKRQGLLAMLALGRGRVVAVDALIDGLWGAELPSAPRNALHHHVARLRAALGEVAILGSADGYALADARIDAVDFEKLLAATRAALRDGDVSAAADFVAAATALWRGPALQGLTGTAWFDAEARRLASLHVDALEEHFEVALALGEHRELVPELRSALADNPFRERLWGQLMLALYRSGRQADALEIFQEARRVLSDELGLEPGPELRRLQESILAQDAAIAAFPSGRRRRGNLPAPASSFVGRDDELAQVAALLQEHRLVTLTGPPGVGKSRLAVEVARAKQSEFPDGIWVVDFGRAGGEEGDALRLLADVLEVRGADPLAGVASRLRHAGGLVVLDACEHVLAEAAHIATTLLAESARLRVVATSREPLHLPGEARVAVAPLSLTASGVEGPSAAAELFLERARAARPGFEADGEAVALAAEIARRVDGLPLALELAAARVNVLGLSELVSILDRRAELLRDTPASDPARAALRGLVDWSYDLLHGDEKALLHQLAVHRGGASRDSLVAVAAAQGLNEATVNYLLAALVDKSVVTVSFSGDAPRYDMLDSVREYVLARLVQDGSLGGVRGAHADYFARMAADARAGLRGAEWQQWLARLNRNNDNLWAALAYAVEEHDSGVAARLGTLGWYFTLDERVSEGRRFLELALATSGDEPAGLRVELLATMCYLATEEFDVGAALEKGERALELASTADVPRELGLAQLTLANAVAYAGDAERADALARDALATLEAAEDDWGIAAAALIRALACAPNGDVAKVSEMAAIARQHADAIGYDAFLAPALILEAWLAERRQESAAAEAYRRAGEFADRVGFCDHAAFALASEASLAFAGGDLGGAEALARRALSSAEAAEALWPAALARVQLARCIAAAGDADAAEQLYREVLDWSQAERPHQAREALFVALAGSPVTSALLGLAELAEARGDAAAADELRARAGLALT